MAPTFYFETFHNTTGAIVEKKSDSKDDDTIVNLNAELREISWEGNQVFERKAKNIMMISEGKATC